MEIFDNATRIVRDNLTETIKPHSRISIVSEKEEHDIESFFGSGQTSFLSGNINGIEL